jgi:excisionase family DNA binding protein
MTATSAAAATVARDVELASLVLSADEVAACLRLDRKTVYEYAARGVIPCKRLGKRVLFPRAALEVWLRSCSRGSSDGGSA